MSTSRRPRVRTAVLAGLIGLCGLAATPHEPVSVAEAAQTEAAQIEGPLPAPPADLGVTGELPVDAAPPDAAAVAALAAELIPVVPVATPAPAATPVPEPGATVSVPPAGQLPIPGAALAAYQRAAQNSAAARPACRMSWPLLASIGRVESSHAQGGRLDAAGTTLGRILGVPLDGSPGVAAIRDTDGGQLDGDRVWDRAVGPMQFIPSTWAPYRTDGNGDGISDPHNLPDAATAAARYLCARGGDMTVGTDLVAALFRYNRSESYVRTVITWAQAYSGGVVPSASLAGPIRPPATRALACSVVCVIVSSMTWCRLCSFVICVDLSSASL